MTGLIALLAAGIIFSAVVPQVRADSIYLIPDSLGTTTAYAMVLNDGNPVLAYYSAVTNGVVMAICGDPSCRTDLTLIRPIESVNITSIAVTIVDGNPFLVYSTTSHSLRIASCIDPTCSQLPQKGPIATGDFSAVTLAVQNGKALFAYESLSQYLTHNIVKLTICNDAACTSTTTRSFSGTDGASDWAGLGLGVLNGNPIIAYTLSQDGSDLNLLMCLSPTCAETPTIKTVDSGYLNIGGIAMTMSSSTPIITYSAEEPNRMWLKAATCTDSACNDPIYTHIVDAVLFYHRETSVSVVNGLPMITYYQLGMRLATCLDMACNYASSTLIADAHHYKGIVQAAQGIPVVSFLQSFPPSSSTALIKIYYGGDTHPPESPTPSNTPTEIPSPAITFAYPTATSTLPTITPSITPTPSFTFTPSNTPTHTPTPITPTSPANVLPMLNYSTNPSVTLTWNYISGAYGYRLEIDDAPDFITPLDTQDLSADTLQHTTGSLDNGIYYWRICAKNSADVCGEWSVTQSFVVSVESS